jgi:muconate cycloisomerase
MVKPIDNEILRVAIPMRIAFKHSLAERRVSDSLVLRLAGDDGSVGYGECAPRDYVTGESAASVEATLGRLLPHVLGQEFESLPAAAEALGQLADGLGRDEHAAFCTLELALLDLVGNATGVSAGTVLGPVLRPTVDYSGVVSSSSPEAVRSMCERMRAQGIADVKLKVGGPLDADVAALRAARSALGPECTIRVDANCAWTAVEALARLEAFAPFGLAAIEQPVAANDLAGMAWLTASSPVPIVADESLVTARDAERLVAMQACHVFNVRISKCGGLLQSRRIQRIGARAGVRTMLGAQVGETSLLSAAGRHFATRTAGVLHCEGSFGTMLLSQDIAKRCVMFGDGGTAPAIDRPGLGVEIDEALLRRLAQQGDAELPEPTVG